MEFNEEIQEWIDYAREEINRERTLNGRTVEAAVEALKTKPGWRSEEQQGYLQEAARLIHAAIAQDSGKSAISVLKKDGHSSWYSPSESVLDPSLSRWLPLAEKIKDDIGEVGFNSVDEASTRVIDGLGNPRIQKLRTKGLVIGYVQSGKTTNITAVIAKAVDAGYRLVVVLTGLTDSLREQTQKRIEKDLIDENRSRWHLLTTREHDFIGDANSSKLANQDERFIAIIKKNQAPLTKLNDWIESAGEAGQRAPILIVDDEADQASVNTAVSTDVLKQQTRINSAIRDLTRHPRTSYVAYTATPFANILIDSNDQDDLYPSDFIHVLNYPQGYFGAAQLFGRDILPGEDPNEFNDDSVDAIRTIPDEEIEHIRPPARNIESWEPRFVDSLRDAVYWFVIATAIRRYREAEEKHSSMLIHTSPRIGAHEKITSEVEFQVRKIIREIETDKCRSFVQDFYNRELQRSPLNPEYAAPVTFEELWVLIGDVAKMITVVKDNSESQARLDYKEDEIQTVIAIGGSTLSRGLTLEGLVSSYFARTTQTYDTLLQMGRWFGFRKGYEDLVRIWMPQELQTWYRDLATIEEDLRREIAYYEIENASPLEMKAKIRLHPHMEVTSRAKQQNAVVRNMSFSGQRIQTISFLHQDPHWIAQNTAAVNTFMELLRREKGAPYHQERNGSYVFRGVDSEKILSFLEDYQFHAINKYASDRTSLLKQYIEHQDRDNQLRSWNVSIIGQRNNVKGQIDLGLGVPVNLINRSKIHSDCEDYANINVLVSPTDRLNDLNLVGGLEELLTEYQSVPKGKKEAFLRAKHEEFAGRGVGHLAIYPIARDSEPMGASANQPSGFRKARTRVSLDAVDHLMGVGIFFPESRADSGLVEYLSGVEHIEPEVGAEIEAQSEEITREGM